MFKPVTTERDRVINEISNVFESVINGNPFPKNVCPKIRKLVSGVCSECGFDQELEDNWIEPTDMGAK